MRHRKLVLLVVVPYAITSGAIALLLLTIGRHGSIFSIPEALGTALGIPFIAVAKLAIQAPEADLYRVALAVFAVLFGVTALFVWLLAHPFGAERVAAREYLDVAWRHSNPAYPVRLVSELDDKRFEVRKLEFFAGGEVGYASKQGSFLSTRLGEAAVPTLQGINGDPEFAATPMDAASFDALWRKYTEARGAS
jgi:hypothetical protein